MTVEGWAAHPHGAGTPGSAGSRRRAFLQRLDPRDGPGRVDVAGLPGRTAGDAELEPGRMGRRGLRPSEDATCGVPRTAPLRRRLRGPLESPRTQRRRAARSPAADARHGRTPVRRSRARTSALTLPVEPVRPEAARVPWTHGTHPAHPPLAHGVDAADRGRRDERRADPGARGAGGPGADRGRRPGADIDQVLAADAYVLGTTANFGYISGALKHFSTASTIRPRTHGGRPFY